MFACVFNVSQLSVTRSPSSVHTESIMVRLQTESPTGVYLAL